jgi:Tfp pilus assembly protein PilN
MIKINFASRKQANSATEGRGPKLFSGVFDGIDISLFKDISIRKAVGAVLIGVIASHVLETYKEEELEKLQNVATKLVADGQKLQNDLDKYKSFDAIKKGLDEDEVIIRTKLETIQKLIATRDRAAKLLIGVSTTIPEEVWLTEFRLEKTADIQMQGVSTDINHITDFMKNLNENAIFSDVEMKNTKQAKENESGQEIANFELSAKRR